LGWVAYPRVALPFGRLPGVTTVQPSGSFTIDSQAFADKQKAFIINRQQAGYGPQNTINLAPINH
jgi:hypothetical protein